MPSLIWSPEALADVQRLYRSLAEKNPDVGRRAAQVIRDGMQIVADQPGIGRPADDMLPEFREWPIPFGASGYVALYRLGPEVAVVVTVRHQKEVGYRAE